MVTYKDYPNREMWLNGRKDSIGASEVAAAIGIKAFMTPKQLWRLKTGREKDKDLSDNSRVEYGTHAEECLRNLFVLKHRHEYDMEYHQFRVYKNSDFPFLSCTLDGEILRKNDGKKGVWECKTVEVTSSKTMEEWNGKIPDHYFAQVVAQLAVTGYSFSIVSVELRFADFSSSIREYFYDSSELSDDIEYVVCGCKKFWENVKSDREPDVVLEL